MKKVLSSLIILTIAFCSFAQAKTTKAQKAEIKAQKETQKLAAEYEKNLAKKQKELEKQAKKDAKSLEKAKANPKDVLKDAEYKELKNIFFNAEGYGPMYNCKVEQEKFCKVKDYDTGLYVLCDRQVSRTQMESAKIFYKYGRCVKLN
jgi:hypothetical protein